MWLSLVSHKSEMSVFKVPKPVVKPMCEYETFKKKKQSTLQSTALVLCLSSEKESFHSSSSNSSSV